MLPVPALASPDCSKPMFSHEARACAAAGAGSEELRRFVQRTAKLYQLSYHDFAQAIPRSGSTVADAVEGRVQRVAAAKPR